MTEIDDAPVHGSHLLLSDSADYQAEGVRTAQDSVPLSLREDVPQHASEIRSWVGNDPERAQRALDAENARDKPRDALVKHLEGLLPPV